MANINITLPVFNEEAQLASSVRTLVAFLHDHPERDCEIVIADNGVSSGDSTAKQSKMLRLRANGTVVAEVSIRDLDDISISISAERESIAGRTNGFLIRRYIGAHYKLALKNANPIDIGAPEIEIEEPMPTK